MANHQHLAEIILAMMANKQNQIDDDDIPMAPILRNKNNQIKITGRNRLCRLFDEDESEEDEDIEDDDCLKIDVFDVQVEDAKVENYHVDESEVDEGNKLQDILSANHLAEFIDRVTEQIKSVIQTPNANQKERYRAVIRLIRLWKLWLGTIGGDLYIIKPSKCSQLTVVSTLTTSNMMIGALPRSVKIDGVRVQDLLKEYSRPRYEIKTRLKLKGKNRKVQLTE
ncbi:hypothetical protein Tco_1568103 [Tanacetum coccineum]